MHNQPPQWPVKDDYFPTGPALLPNPVKLHPVDQQTLELTGELPNLPLFVNPQLLANLREPVSSVHTIETSSRNFTGVDDSPNEGNVESSLDEYDQRIDYTYRGYLLKPRIAAYRRAVEIYAAVDGSFSGKFSLRLQACRKYAYFTQNTVTKKLRVQSSRCKLRWCPICRDVSRMIVTSATEKWLQIQKYPKMVTLTVKHSDDPLELQVKRIYACFKKLRTRAYFQRLITGGVWFFQLKFNHDTEQWHPHIHCLVAGKYLPHPRLKALWKTITGDSDIVDIRPVKDLEGCAREVARYATSPADVTAVDQERAMDIYYSTKHRRVCGSWGSARSVTLSPKLADDRDMWMKVADFYFVNVKKQFDPKVKAFWKCFKQDKPYDGPDVQDMRDVYHDELDIMLNDCFDDMTYEQFQLKIRRDRSKKWNLFFDKEHAS